MNNRGRWRIGALASAIALLGSMASLEAHALALGQINVQSALGESLRAEIDIADINTEEASSLRVGIASAEVFKAAGLEYTAALAGLDVKLQRRADGRFYLRLSSNHAITEPFVDLILEAKWPSGHVTRDYTMLLDPPNLHANSTAMATPISPMLSQAPVSSAGLPASASPPTRPARPVATLKATASKPPASERMPVGARQLEVKPGDTASGIAAQNKPANVSLDQMLVALLRSNPNAFVGGNINVIKSGAVLDMPDAEAANALTPGEATQTLIAQSKDFNSFRRKLAQDVPLIQTDSATRQISGGVQARVEDRAQVNTPPDKLTLSKGAVQRKATTSPDDKGADGSSRTAELSKNISDLNKLGALHATSPATAVPGITVPAPPPALTSSVAAESVITPALTTASAADQNPNTSAPVTDSTATPLAPAAEPASAVSAPVAPTLAAVKKPALITPPPPEPGLMDQLLEHALFLLLIGGLFALLAGLAIFRYRKHKKLSHIDSSFLDSRLQPDSFFGASGGRRIDTSENNAGGSSIAYTPSQLDTAGDVDPVAEADVYLAYGRDQQAEEILREAMRNYPERVAIHTKLLEIYAKRRDIKGFESVALIAFKLTKGNGPEWAYICELGKDLDPASSLYQPGAVPSSRNAPENPASTFLPVSVIAPLDLPAMVPAPASTNAVDLDLDFSLDEIPGAPVAHAPIPAPAPAPYSPPPISSFDSGSAMPSAILNLDDLDLDLNFDMAPAVAPPAVASVPPSTKATAPVIDFLAEGLDFTPESYATPLVPIEPATPVTHSGMLEFDLNSLSLDLGPSTESPKPALTEPEEDPLEIKFLLAEEFRILGDSDGARSLADEVLAKARGPLKVKVQAFLNALP